MAISAGFFGRAFRRSEPKPPPVVGLLPVSGHQLRMKVEPRLAELVGTVVATLRASGVNPIPVTDPHGRQWAPAYVLGQLELKHTQAEAASNMAVAEVMLDGSGRLARNHPVQVTGNAHRLVPVSCPSLADNYEQFIRALKVADEPRGDGLVLTPHGSLMIAGPEGEPVNLADYLDSLCRTGAYVRQS